MVMKTESRKDVVEKDVSNVSGRGSFVARAENYPLRKTMVYHNQNRIEAVGQWEIGDEVHRDLLEGMGAIGGDRSEWGYGGVCVDLIGLTHSTTSNEAANEGGYTGPPVVLLEKGDGVEITTVGTHQRFMDVFDKGVLGRFGDVEA